MSKIQILSEHLANQIAAGEVIERPASVVKELLENSLDAGATRITVEISGSGAKLIRVIDNGEGMDSDDVLLALERHATSKLRDEAQLSAITTLGFRGEALPSIGSVSRLSILSRTGNQEIGTRAEVRFGTLQAVHEDGCARGTVIEVRNLFGNLPARKKFLKSERTEQHHIEEVVRNQALAHHATGFTLLVNGRTILDLPAADGRESRVRDILRHSGSFFAVEGCRDQAGGAELSVYLLPPDTIRSARARLRILVNSRPVQDRMIRHGVMEGLQGFLLKGQQPVGVVYLDVDPDQVDINVHPAKHEVRFRNSRQVHGFLVRAVRQAVTGYQEQLRSRLFTPPPVETGEPERDVAVTETGESPPKFAVDLVGSGTRQEPPVQTVIQPSPAVRRPVPARSGEAAGPENRFAGLRLIGQFMQLYLLCERDESLVVIDQHAAHERIIYQRFRTAYEQQEMASQNLLFPVTVELTPGQAEVLEQHRDEVASLGIEVSHFGDLTWLVKAVPALAGQLAPEEILADVLQALATATGDPAAGRLPAYLDTLFASMACKAAVKAGHRLTPEEMLDLLRQMEESAAFSHCPHGRPVIRTFSRHEIERWFHRA